MAKELRLTDVMVGDWVDVRNDAVPNTPHFEQISPAHMLRDEHWYGINLTAEILEKNGFSRKGHDHYHYEVGDYGALAGYPMFGGFTEIFFQYNGAKLMMQICYVHELQHALKLCGINKDIQL